MMKVNLSPRVKLVVFLARVQNKGNVSANQYLVKVKSIVQENAMGLQSATYVGSATV
jgi:hypothetical protein